MERVISHDFPLSFVHEGSVLGNGYCGLMLWGEERTLNISVGCASLWDHRGGMRWTAKQNLADIRAALAKGDEEAIKAIFASDTAQDKGQPSRPSLIPVGRVELILQEGCCLERCEMYLAEGLLRAVYSRDGAENACLLRLDMGDKGRFACQCNDLESFRVIPAYELTQGAMAAISFAAPTEVATAAGWRGFLQPMPADEPYALVLKHYYNQLSGFFGRAADASSLETQVAALDNGCFWDDLSEGNQRWWSEYWREVPSIALDNPRLEELYYLGLFKFAAMTTPDGVAAGLQGPWIEDHALPPWSGDYHFNINVQMCYGPAYRANRLEHLRPLFELVWSWREQLRDNARHFVGIDDGYMLPHAVDDRCTCMGAFWTGTIDHACAAWIAQMMFDYVDYSGDQRFLRETAFDFMRGTMRVFEAMLERRTDGRLELPLSVSPEYRGAAMNAWGANASFQLAAMQRLALNLLRAAEWLGEEPAAAWLDIRENLPQASLYGPAGKEEIALWDGQLLEESHRHHSHLAALCPFDSIDADAPEWRDVVARSRQRWIEKGMSRWTGWCMTWASMLNSRFNNGRMAELILEIWQRVFTNDGGGTLHDAAFSGFSLHAGNPRIMQMDAAMGAVSAIQDMILHSRQGVLHLLAGMPPRWRYLRCTDMPAPGGFRISVDYQKRGAVLITVKATRDGQLRLLVHLPGALSAQLGEECFDGSGLLERSMRAGQELQVRRG
jgi:alpha-L-fucosidase 2